MKRQKIQTRRQLRCNDLAIIRIVAHGLAQGHVHEGQGYGVGLGVNGD